MKDGRVVIVGGTNGVISSDVEIFDPSSGTSSLVSLLPQPRTGHAAARLGDGSVLIVGGSTIDGVVLQSAAIFDPATGAVTATAGLQQARVGASATTLIDGRVLIVGGNNGSVDLGTAEIFDPFFQTFTVVSTQLSVPRSGHTAVLLPHNNSVLIAGGTAAGVAVTATDLFLPAQFPDPYSYGTGQFAATGSLGTARRRRRRRTGGRQRLRVRRGRRAGRCGGIPVRDHQDRQGRLRTGRAGGHHRIGMAGE
jgi:hypothetical protein